MSFSAMATTLGTTMTREYVRWSVWAGLMESLGTVRRPEKVLLSDTEGRGGWGGWSIVGLGGWEEGLAGY